MKDNPFANLPRCGAKTRMGSPCRRPAGPKGRCHLHGGAPGSGAPFGNRNAWKHGFYSRESSEERLRIRAFLLQTDRFLDQL